MLNFPLTGVATLVGAIAMAIAVYVIGQRMAHSRVPSFKQIRLFRSFFLFMSIFFVIMTLPYIWLETDPAKFGLVAAICYTVAHLFSSIAIIFLARMTCTIIPQLNKWETPVTWLLVALGVIAAVVTGVTMIGGTRPTYSAVTAVTDWHAPQSVGLLIALGAVFGIIIPVGMFTINAIKSRGPQRLRSLLLGLGLFMIAGGGVTNDNVQSQNLLLFAGTVILFGVIILATGVVYQITEELSVVREKVVPAPSNTV